MKTLIAYLSLFLISCSTYKTVRNKELQVLNNQLEGKFQSTPILIKSNHFKTNMENLFEITNSDSLLRLKVNSNNELEIRYKNQLGGKEVQTFKGKFKRKYFKIFLEKDRITFPPFYWVTKVNRLKIGLDKKGQLVINQHFDHSAMIMLFAAGSSSNNQYVFKQSKNMCPFFC